MAGQKTKGEPSCAEPGQGSSRRSVLAGALGLGLTPLAARAGFTATDPSKERPQPGDVVVYFAGERKGQPILAEDLPLGGPQELAYPMDPATNTIRDRSRLNQIAVVRVDPEELSEQTAKHAADGVVAYSAFCTHQGCPVSMWDSNKAALLCSCHASMFDPRNAAQVVGGPAPRRLAMLPVTLEDGTVVVAGEFVGSIGIQKV